MSHIPSTAMPHAHANGDEPRQEDGARPEPEATTATPRQPEPATAVDTAAEPLATSATDRAQDMAAAGPSNDDEPPLASAAPGTATGARDGSDADRTAETATGGARSPALLAAMVLGGLAALGGLVAAALPLIRERDDRKGKKGKKRKG